MRFCSLVSFCPSRVEVRHIGAMYYPLVFGLAFVFILNTDGQYTCREINVYKSSCEIFDFSAPNCFKWNTTQCPTPRIQENTYCSIYSCSKVQRSSNPQDDVGSSNLATPVPVARLPKDEIYSISGKKEKATTQGKKEICGELLWAEIVLSHVFYFLL